MQEKLPQYVNSITELKTLFLNVNINQNVVRFFIEPENIEPRMFGIFTDGNEFVVFKSKDDGTYVERYRGKDEAKACNILYDRFLEECRNRKDFIKYLPNNYDENIISREGNSLNTIKAKQKKQKKLLSIIIIVFISFSLFTTFFGSRNKIKNGYYINNNDRYYYRDDTWYRYDDFTNDWIFYGYVLDDYDNYTYYDSYDYYDYSNQGHIDDDYYFENSDAYNDYSYQSYDGDDSNDDDWYSWDSGSWDSGGSTDWGSDW